jgi:pterin-4a-carbinolamine dehydratase
MSLIAFLVIAAGGLIYTAAKFQDYGQAWAFSTCASLPESCDHPDIVLISAVVVAGILFVVRTIIDV